MSDPTAPPGTAAGPGFSEPAPVAYGSPAWQPPAYPPPGQQPPAFPSPWPGPGFPPQPNRTGQLSSHRPDYAPWGRRAGAYLIDSAPSLTANLVFLVGYLMALIDLFRRSGNGGSLDLGAGRGWMGVGAVLLVLAFGWTIYNRWIVGGRTGQSLGRRMLGIVLVSEMTGRPIGPFDAFVRDLVHILDGLAYVGFLWPLWDDKRQTFADMIMRTIVVDATAAAARDASPAVNPGPPPPEHAGGPAVSSG